MTSLHLNDMLLECQAASASDSDSDSTKLSLLFCGSGRTQRTFPGGKGAARETGHSYPSNVRLRMVGLCLHSALLL
jgi:hypothetical protein